MVKASERDVEYVTGGIREASVIHLKLSFVAYTDSVFLFRSKVYLVLIYRILNHRCLFKSTIRLLYQVTYELTIA